MKNYLFALIFLTISSALFAQDDINLLDLVREPVLVDSVRVVEIPQSEVSQSEFAPTEYDWRNQRQSLIVSYGAPSLLATTISGLVWLLDLGEEKFPLFVGPVSVEYDYNIKRWLRVGGRLSYMFVRDYRKYYSGDDHVIGLTGRVDFTYLNRRKIKLYSGLEAGAGVQFGKPDSRYVEDNVLFSPMFNVCLFGLQAGGDHVFFMSELGLGTVESLRLGLGVHF